jgi:hypothetical protein
MREQMKEMELELLQYHKSNAALDLMIGELKLKRDGMQREVDKLRAEIAARNADLTKISRDVVAVHTIAGDAKALRVAITRLYHRYIHGDVGNMASAMAVLGSGDDQASGAPADSIEPPSESSFFANSVAPTSAPAGKIAPIGIDPEDLQIELARQRQHLERKCVPVTPLHTCIHVTLYVPILFCSLDSLRRKVTKEAQSSELDRARLMRENTALTQEINDLRRDLRFMQAEVARARDDPELVDPTSRGPPPQTPSGGATFLRAPTVPTGTLGSSSGGMHGTAGPGRGRRTAALLGVLVAAPGTAIKALEGAAESRPISGSSAMLQKVA